MSFESKWLKKNPRCSGGLSRGEMELQRENSGFTLLEMLVVLIILGLITSLLSKGLTTTWQNFQRLSARDLALSTAQLPVQWFRDGIKHALLYHPDHGVVRATEERFRFVTAASPDARDGVPSKIEWIISSDVDASFLRFAREDGDTVTVATSVRPFKFQYLAKGKWTDGFLPSNSQLPTAIRILEGHDIWVYAIPGDQ